MRGDSAFAGLVVTRYRDGARQPDDDTKNRAWATPGTDTLWVGPPTAAGARGRRGPAPERKVMAAPKYVLWCHRTVTKERAHRTRRNAGDLGRGNPAPACGTDPECHKCDRQQVYARSPANLCRRRWLNRFCLSAADGDVSRLRTSFLSGSMLYRAKYTPPRGGRARSGDCFTVRRLGRYTSI